jgi:hypothetical protein
VEVSPEIHSTHNSFASTPGKDYVPERLFIPSGHKKTGSQTAAGMVLFQSDFYKSDDDRCKNNINRKLD